jgi:hypothetical protein
MPKKTLFLIGLASLLAVGFSLAGDIDQADRLGEAPPAEPPESIFSLETSFDRLSHWVDLWHDAHLKGNDKEIEKLDSEIDRILSEDIQASRAIVKTVCEEWILKNASGPEQSRNLIEERASESEQQEHQEMVELMIGFANTKAELYKSISKTEAFSNKYRLLGDYINLLRKELDMPRVRLAGRPAEEVPKP